MPNVVLGAETAFFLLVLGAPVIGKLEELKESMAWGIADEKKEREENREEMVVVSWNVQRGNAGYATLPLTVSDDKCTLYGVTYKKSKNDGYALSWIFEIDLYKLRGYTTVQGKKIYHRWSAVRRCKIR